jgi:hypothetical protein
MGQIAEFKKVKLFCGLIFSQTVAAEKAKNILGEHFSAIDSQSDVIPFALTDYYQVEMGAPLFRQFFSFAELVNPEKLPEIKIFTNKLEKQLTKSGKRTINIDPGYISDANVIIATCKNHYHRVPLKRGIYAHLEYILKNKQLFFLPWTYPDFKTEEYISFFNELMGIYRGQIKNKKG